MRTSNEQLTVERSALRAVSRRFLPVIGLCYVVLYVDRLNIGIAALTMNSDLGLSASAFGFAAGVYFWTYAALEPPSNYVLTRMGARRWISRIMVTWGLVTIGTGFVQDAAGLTVARVLLGVAEAGFSPGMLYFVSRWYPAAHRGRAMGWIVSFICLSALGTPITTHILDMDGVLGLAGWRWIFVLTGIPAVIMGLVVFRVLREEPAEAEFLSSEQRTWLIEAQAAERDGGGHEVDARSFVRGLLHPRVLVLVVVWLCFTFCLNGFQLWMPQIFAQLGMSTSTIGYVAALPALLAIGPMLWWVRRSDRRGERAVHFVVAAAVAAAGFAIAAVGFTVPVVAICGFCIAGIGLYTTMAVFITMPASFLGGAGLAAGFGVINGVGNLGGYWGPQITGWLRDSTNSFVPAIGVYAGVLTLAALIVLTQSVLDGRRVTHPRRPISPSVAPARAATS